MTMPHSCSTISSSVLRWPMFHSWMSWRETTGIFRVVCTIHTNQSWNSINDHRMVLLLNKNILIVDLVISVTFNKQSITATLGHFLMLATSHKNYSLKYPSYIKKIILLQLLWVIYHPIITINQQFWKKVYCHYKKNNKYKKSPSNRRVGQSI